MDRFKKLLDVASVLLGPNGCPWDREQTLLSLQPYLLEEAHELIEAIDMQDPQKMKEELGDLLYTVIFVAKLAEKEKLFTLFDSIEAITEKLIRRHPHIFSGVQVKDSEDVMRNWEEIKMKEGRKSPFEGIPPTLPALARVQKVISKLRRKKERNSEGLVPITEQELGDKLWDLVKRAECSSLDAESILRRLCMEKEKNTGD
jgi:tetrapyrrole methylase family protein/MazG family protein